MRTFWTLLMIGAAFSPAEAQTPAYGTWQDYGGSPDAAQYSSLHQIDRTNVARLRRAWTYSTGDTHRYSFNPLIVGRVAYVMAHNNAIVSIDAASGKQLWIHAADPDSRLITNRGINYWESADRKDRRLLYAENNQLRALDAATGRPIISFGRHGSVDLRQGLGRNPDDIVLVQSNTPGKVFDHFLILGSATNQEYESAPGDIRAYDVVSGRLAWSFHTIPHPGETGYETWPPDAWKTIGGANAWGELSVDEVRGIVYVPTGSPKYNFYGANRKGANLFGDCLLALDARTGKRIWHYQMVHHDIWDYDNCTAPKLLTVKHNGQMVDVVAEAGKQGFVWVFNRETGEPLWPIEERPVPRSDMPGEETWPTQPFPTKPPAFARQRFTVDDLSPFLRDPAERARWLDDLLSARNEGMFTPPGLRNTVQMPGNNGGANWGSAAANPVSGMLYVVSKDLPAMLKLEAEVDPEHVPNASPEQAGQAVYEALCQRCHHADLKGQPPAVPSLVNIGARMKPAQVMRMVAQGGGLMPANPKLPAADLQTLNAFLFSKHASVPVKQDAPETKHLTAATRYRSGFNFMLTSTGLSPIAPPWTSLTAYDLNEGTIKWKVPLGEVPELAAQGFKETGSHFPKVGPVVTAGGLIFTGTRDRKVRALDADNGRVLWEAEVESALEGMPAVFAVDGKQYVLFCAAAQTATTLLGGNGRPATQGQASSGAYVAFALPDELTRGQHETN